MLPYAVLVWCGSRVGSGFCCRPWHDAEVVITAAHVVSPSNDCLLFWEEGDVVGEVVARDSHMDVAIVRPGRQLPLPALDFASMPSPGEVFAATMEGIVLEGDELCRLRWRVGGACAGDRLVWMPAPVPGMSGGPVLDDEGRLLGVITHHLAGVGGAGAGWWVVHRLLEGLGRGGA